LKNIVTLKSRLGVTYRAKLCMIWISPDIMGLSSFTSMQ